MRQVLRSLRSALALVLLSVSPSWAWTSGWQPSVSLDQVNPFTARQEFSGGLDVQYSSVLFDRLSVNSSGNLLFQATEKAPGAATAALAGLGAGNVNNGTHSYKVTFVTAGGETDAGAVSGTVTTTAGDGQVALSAIPTGSAYVTSRKVYRTAAGNAVTGPWLLLATIANNTATTYADNTADASLTTAAPTTNTAIDTRWTFQNSGIWTPGATGVSDLGSGTLGFKRLYVDYTNTATIGAVTINKASFRANIALGATSVVVTNSYVTAASKVLCMAAANDTTGRVTASVPAAGSVTIYSVATTANMAVDCLVVNAD